MKDQNIKMLSYLLKHNTLRTVSINIGLPKKNLQQFLDGKEPYLEYRVKENIRALYYRKRTIHRFFRLR